MDITPRTAKGGTMPDLLSGSPFTMHPMEHAQGHQVGEPFWAHIVVLQGRLFQMVQRIKSDFADNQSTLMGEILKMSAWLEK